MTSLGFVVLFAGAIVLGIVGGVGIKHFAGRDQLSRLLEYQHQFRVVVYKPLTPEMIYVFTFDGGSSYFRLTQDHNGKVVEFTPASLSKEEALDHSQKTGTYQAAKYL